MKKMKSIRSLLIAIGIGMTSLVLANGNPNQTSDVSPIYPETELPFRVNIELADFEMPNGIHSGVFGVYNEKWIFLAGRTNGMHAFNDDPNNFPPQEQNQIVYVVDPEKKKVWSRSLAESGSGLTQEQIDQLSVTSPQFYHKGRVLYMTGGYGVDTATGDFSTKDVLTAIDMPGLMHWVVKPYKHETAAQHIRQLYDESFRVTGGDMRQFGSAPTLLFFGQNFPGYYFDPTTNGQYVEQVRRFYIFDNGINLAVKFLDPLPAVQDGNYRRRDLTIFPRVHKARNGKLVASYVAYSGVFTENDGIWTVPVEITAKGSPTMADPTLPSTFKQGMNNYVVAALGLFSKKTSDMYTIFMGGISYGYFEGGVFKTDPEFPFINQVTTVRIDKHGDYKQYLMTAEYPVILSTQSNPGNPLLFGAGAQFVIAEEVPMYSNEVLKLDHLRCHSKVVGYIVGGIQSTLPNTNVPSDSSASAYIFKVSVVPVH